MPAPALRRKVTKGRVVRAPDGFEVGQSVNFVAISPRTWIMTLETVEEAERLAAALPATAPSPWSEAMARVAGIAHAAGRRPRKAGSVESESSTSDAEAVAFATIATPKRRPRDGRGVVHGCCWVAVTAAPSADAFAGGSRVASGASGAARILWVDRRYRRKRHHAAAT
jgi:hypothetical protein